MVRVNLLLFLATCNPQNLASIQALLLVRFNDDDGLKMVLPQEKLPLHGVHLLSSPLRPHTASLRNKMIDPDALPQIMGRQYRDRLVSSPHVSAYRQRAAVLSSHFH
ncbi:hypothetical protein JOB18_035370 [Solea senegalensis]|uniref:Uncharacterized protein n=1 Tax=Solea senegalensis TaxID=28829 RepID=A0AAV6PIP6_SOLSE|nr:hypothetical protein JOB18_035370 [Solea senegalensis]